jgi:hypothetical protein
MNTDDMIEYNYIIQEKVGHPLATTPGAVGHVAKGQ